MKRTSVRSWLEALDRATEWELFDARRLPPVPRWFQIATAVAFVLLTVASLAAALWGGPS
jgi:hypothetical protein